MKSRAQSLNVLFLYFTVLAMESQAEALNQLTTDDLEGKVTVLNFLLWFTTCLFMF